MTPQRWGSNPDGLKLFLDEDNNHISNTIFGYVWLQKDKQVNKNALQEIDLQQAAIGLDKWSKMCATWAKDPFAITKLTKAMKHSYVSLGIHRDLVSYR